MAEIVTLKVNVDRGQLTALQADLAKLQSKTVDIKVNASGFAALDKNIVKNINSVSRFVNAASRLEKTQAQVRIAQERTAQATQRRMTAESQLAAQQARLATQNARTATEEARLATQTQKTATEEAKAATQAQRVAQERAKLATQTQRTATEEARLATQQERTRTAQARASASQQRMIRSTNEATQANNNLITSLASSAKGMAQSMLTAALIYKPVQSFKEALETMKAVDAELVNVGKVTKWPEERLKAMGEQAYKTASEYGVAANEYLSSVTEFTRAGYLGQSEALAELANKTQIVGDTTADVANQFLLAVDKGYQMGGSVEKLSAVLDGANEIGNNFATSIPKIAEGLGKVAPIGAQAKVGIDELSAAIGTVTAVTQRSGTEAATALRALFLNIMGDTKTEIDEGVTWTTGEIAGLRDVLNIYASDVVAAADATGSLINPMEAIGALSQSMKDGVLTEQKLMEMVSDIGGKLRTSQLLALIQNWDMYEAMLDKYEKAAGSADREVERAMDSWGRKTEVLKNTWTQFVSHIVETDTIKGTITGVTDVISGLDTQFGHVALSVGTWTLGIMGAAKAVNALGTAFASSKLMSGINYLRSMNALGGAQGVMKGLGFLIKTNPVIAGGLAFAGLYTLVKELRKVAPTVEHARDEIEKLQAQLEEGFGGGSEYEDLLSRADSLTAAEQQRLTILKAQKQALEGQIEDTKELEFARFQNNLGIGNERQEMSGKTIDETRLDKMRKTQESLTEAFQAGEIGATEFKKGLTDLISESEEYYNALVKYKDAGYDLTQAQKATIERYESIAQLLGTAENGYLSAAVALERFDAAAEVGGKTLLNGDALKKSLEEAGATAEQIESILANIGEDENTILIDIEADPKAALDALKEVGIAAENADGTIEIDYSAFSGLMSQLGYTNEEASSLTQNLRELGNVTFTNLPGQMDATGAKIESVSERTQNAKRQLDALGSTKAQPKIELKDDGAQARIEAIKSSLAGIPRSINVAIRVANGTAGAITGSMLSPYLPKRADAEGTDAFPGGKTLVNELGPEIIREGGRARIAAGGRPTITTVARGAQIFTAEETRDILSGRGQDIPLASFAFGAKKSGSISSLSSNGTGLSEFAHSRPAGSQTSSGSGSPSSAGKKSASGSTARKSSSGSGSSGKSGGSSGGGNDAQLEALQADLELLKAQYSFLEASGAGADALTAKSKEIQTALHNINNYLRATNGEEKDIVSNSTDWWKELETIKSTITEAYEAERDLLDTEIELSQRQGLNVGTQLEKYRQIQDSLHKQAQYLRQIGASQAEINKLSLEWWDVQEDIKKAQEDLWDELSDAVDWELQRADEAREAEIKAIDYLIEQKEAARDAAKEEKETQEKLLRIEEARAALENAKNERTVRMFNAQTGQWEWIADPKTVKSAQDELDEAEKDWREYQEELAYQKEIREMERRKKAINDQYDELEKSWKKITQSMQQPARKISDILDDIAKNGTPQMKAQIGNVNKLLGDLGNYIKGVIGIGTGDSYFDEYWSQPFDQTKVDEVVTQGKDYSQDTADYHAMMERASNVDDFYYFAAQRQAKMEALGIKAGVDKDANGNVYKTNEQIWKEWQANHKGWENVPTNMGAPYTPVTGGGKTYASVNGKAPAGMKVGDQVVTQGGTYEITGFNPDGTYQSKYVSDTTKDTYKGSYANSSGSSSSGSSGSKGSGSSSGSSSSGNKGGGTYASVNGKAPSGLSAGDKVVTQGGTYKITGVNKDGSYQSQKVSSQTKSDYEKNGGTYSKKYDEGGILRGLGGIKATAENEMVLPPDITAALLKPSADAVFQQRMKELGLIYGTPQRLGPQLASTARTGNSYDHYGDEYHMGNITLSEAQAKSMTVYDLAQKARNLTLFNGR